MGLEYEIHPPDLDESRFDITEPRQLVTALAAAKAGAVRTERACPERWILAADTVVVVDDRSGTGIILGKPRDRRSAGRMMELLSGRSHVVLTGIAVWPPGEAAPDVRVAETRVSFDQISAGELDRYLDTGDWRGVAGAYRIQGQAALHIDRIEGSYSNVVGLPIHLVYSILRQHGFPGL